MHVPVQCSAVLGACVNLSSVVVLYYGLHFRYVMSPDLQAALLILALRCCTSYRMCIYAMWSQCEEEGMVTISGGGVESEIRRGNNVSTSWNRDSETFAYH